MKGDLALPTKQIGKIISSVIDEMVKGNLDENELDKYMYDKIPYKENDKIEYLINNKVYKYITIRNKMAILDYNGQRKQVFWLALLVDFKKVD